MNVWSSNVRCTFTVSLTRNDAIRNSSVASYVENSYLYLRTVLYIICDRMVRLVLFGYIEHSLCTIEIYHVVQYCI